MLINDQMISKYYISAYEDINIQITEYKKSSDGKNQQLLHKITSTCMVSYENLFLDYTDSKFVDLNIDLLKKINGIEMLLIGTGITHSFPAKQLYCKLGELPYSIDFMDTHAACRTFNILTNENRKVAALLFI
ncbi:MAG: MTH938/NDUFAF3 family protein [Pseudomonadota bacterium]